MKKKNIFPLKFLMEAGISNKNSGKKIREFVCDFGSIGMIVVIGINKKKTNIKSFEKTSVQRFAL